MDDFESAIRNTAKELEQEHEFHFDDDGVEEFVAVIKKHLSQFVDYERYKQDRIRMLRSELTALEGS